MEEGNHLLVSLYEALDRDPSSVYVLERLLEAWKEIGDKGKECLAMASTCFSP